LFFCFFYCFLLFFVIQVIDYNYITHYDDSLTDCFTVNTDKVETNLNISLQENSMQQFEKDRMLDKKKDSRTGKTNVITNTLQNNKKLFSLREKDYHNYLIISYVLMLKHVRACRFSVTFILSLDKKSDENNIIVA
jgi:hypothetical protein